MKKLARWLMEQSLRLDPSVEFDEVTIHLVGHQRMKEINQAIFHRTYATDVISQSYTPHPGESLHREGEVFVNVALAVETAKADDPVWTHNHECALYIAHGCHHLMGAEDDTPEKKSDMLTLETEWVKQADREGLVGSLL